MASTRAADDARAVIGAGVGGAGGDAHGACDSASGGAAGGSAGGPAYGSASSTAPGFADDASHGEQGEHGGDATKLSDDALGGALCLVSQTRRQALPISYLSRPSRHERRGRQHRAARCDREKSVASADGPVSSGPIEAGKNSGRA